MKTITDLDNLVQTYHFYDDKRSYFLEAAMKCTEDYHFSIDYDGHFLCTMISDDPSFIPTSLQHILFSLVFDADSYLCSFCKDHNILYSPIHNDRYLFWLSAQHQSK